MSTPSLPISAKNVGLLLAELITPRQLTTLAGQHRSAAGAPATLSAFWLVAAMVYHVLQPGGLLSRHVRELTRKQMADSTLSERRQVLGLGLFQALLDRILLARASLSEQPGAFYKGFRLVGMDGSQWNVTNTPEIKRTTRKVRSRRRSSAFYRLSMTALYELGTHTPLAVRIGMAGESEMTLATMLLSRLETDWLLLADRYYGVAAFLRKLPTDVHFLIRVRRNLKSKRLQRFRDGSCLVEIRENASGTTIMLREIHARVCRRGGRWVTVRLWTNLLDPAVYPAQELVKLYGVRWEHECAYRELKVHLRRESVLQSHTVVTAAQEIACLVLAQALIARVRLTAAGSRIPVLQVSFVHTLHVFRSIGALSMVLDDLIPEELWPAILRRLLRWITSVVTPPRRQRSCPRALRQPVSGWPRLLKNSSASGPFLFKIVSKPS